MIISDKFAWLHFPKCAGSETERFLKQNFGSNPAVAFDPVNPANVIWHHSINDRIKYDPAFRLDGRAVICNIRRLPAWLLSRIHFEYHRSPQFRVTREMFTAGQFFESSGFLSKADSYAKKYSHPEVTHWIRTERLAEDLQSTFSEYLDLSGIDIASQLRRGNVTQIRYIPEIEFYFTKDEVQALYDANPIWAGIERKVYGQLYQYRG
jgi:hypothetical protein